MATRRTKLPVFVYLSELSGKQMTGIYISLSLVAAAISRTAFIFNRRQQRLMQSKQSR